jgi:stage II sporulation protein AA (anti-sigma F factor antagonist)
MLESAIINKAAQNLVFDLTNLTFMDSSGIGVIIGRYKLIKSIGGNVCIASNNSSINRLISLSGLMRLMEVYETADLATESIQGGR